MATYTFPAIDCDGVRFPPNSRASDRVNEGRLHTVTLPFTDRRSSLIPLRVDWFGPPRAIVTGSLPTRAVPITAPLAAMAVDVATSGYKDKQHLSLWGTQELTDVVANRNRVKAQVRPPLPGR